MPSFRNPRAQAERAVSRATAIGIARHDSKNDGRVHSIGTARAYTQALTNAAQWMRQQGNNAGLQRMTPELARAYLEHRAQQVSQKTLDLDRQALRILPNVGDIERVRSQSDHRGLGEQARAYTQEQVHAIAAAQSAHNALATEIAYAAGLRAHELLTLRPAAEASASAHREWRDDRFAAREGERYTVEGKGGLTREVLIPRDLAARLEAARLPEPREVTDRGVHYTQHYNIGGGNAWSASFSRASMRELGWSTGAHGLRHSYAQERIDELQAAGHGFDDARELVSQELGHFRADITDVYLR